MRFADPGILWLLLLLPVLGLGALAAAAPRRRQAPRLPRAAGAALTAAARPRGGSRLEPITRRGVDVVLVMDTSRSMAAEDVAPNRISQARHAAPSLIRRLPGGRV